MNEGLSCSCPMPLAWHVVQLDENRRRGMMREAGLVLAALNQMESSRDLDTSAAENRRLERLEAKLDLALYLLARALEPAPAPEHRLVTLSPRSAEWADAAPPPAGMALVLELRPSEQLPLLLKLPAVAREALSGQARVRFENMPEDLEDALHQFVFRRHRQAIRLRAG
jgi:hypothetical protein